MHKRPRFLPTSLIPRAVRPPERPRMRSVRDHLNDSVPPRSAPRSTWTVVIAIALTAATMAFAAGRIFTSNSAGQADSEVSAAAEQGTRALVDESMHRHLRSLR